MSIWDLWLLPWCTAPDDAGQASVADWLAARLGVQAGLAPPRLARVVEAFEAQLEAERTADELEYGQDGRLRFAADLARDPENGRGRDAASPLSFMRKHRYGETHVAARVREVDELARRIERYLAALTTRREELARYSAQTVWADEGFGRRAAESLVAAAEEIRALGRRTRRVREGFEALPRHAADPGIAPECIEYEPVEA